jgi:L-iditol 2-dehydrogenase
MLQPIPKTMRALVYRGINDLRVETVPVPRIGPRELLVQVAVCGVCPTDIKKIQFGTVPPPRIFGHETSGTIVRKGALVQGFEVGDGVALHHHVPCLSCHACRHESFAQCAQYKRTGITAGFEPAGGGFAEYVRVMSFVLPGAVPIPARNSFEEGAMLEPVNTVLKAVRRLRLLPGDWVLVVGQGPIGLMFTRILKLHGQRVLATDRLTERLRAARAFGADRISTQTAVRQALEEARLRKLDAAIVTVPSDAAVRDAHQLVRGGGAVLVFGHTRRGSAAEIDLSTVCVNETALVGSYSSDIHLQAECAQLVFRRRLDVRPLITHRTALGQAPRALQQAANPEGSRLKTVIYLSGAPSDGARAAAFKKKAEKV